MNDAVSHNREADSIEEKTRWFRSLPLSERMELLCEFTELALSQNPDLVERKDAPTLTGRIQILRLP